MGILKALLGDENKKKLKKIQPIVEKINAFEPDIEKLSDANLKKKTDEFRARLKKGESLDDLLPEAYAVVREAAKRTLGQRHFDVQLVGGIVMHQSGIAEMKTGEGKTLVATLPAYLNALCDKGVHIITVNDYLSRRDAVWMGQVYEALGMTVAVINDRSSFLYSKNKDQDERRDAIGSFKVMEEFLEECTRREAYEADVTYGTNNEFGFDYLRDNLEFSPNELRQRKFHYAIIDEIDSILIDEARTPLIISAPSQDSENLYKTFSGIASKMEKDKDYEVDEKRRAITLTDSGIEKAERALGVKNIYTDKGIKYVHHLETAVRAKALYERDQQYVVKDGRVILVDEFTGRLMPSKRLSEGMHQAIEAKEGLETQRESITVASITYQNFFRMYKKLSGMTGTASSSAEEFYKVYGIDVVEIPTNKPIARLDRNDLIFQTELGKFKAVARKIKDLNTKGQPVLVGTVSIEKNELLSEFLNQNGIKHEILNAKNHEREGEIIAQAGRKGAVTLSTNMAGRGVDIKLGGPEASKEQSQEIKDLGGLFVLGTERHEARRIDNQLRGRSGRQGDPGETQFFVSLEDSLMRVFASDTVKSMMGRLGIPEDEAIQNKMITRSLETAQKRIEGFHFDARKTVLQYDDVLNQQRTAIYEKRNHILTGGVSALQEYFIELEQIANDQEIKSLKEKKELIVTDEALRDSIRRVILRTIDMHWIEHLEVMDYTRSSVNLRAYGQRDPLVEYKREGLKLFAELEDNIKTEIVQMIPKIETNVAIEEYRNLQETHKNAQSVTSGNRQPQRRVVSHKYGRNETVTIEKDGEVQELKYKKAEPLLAQGWRIRS